MLMKGYPTLLRSPELEPHHQMQFSVILTFFEGRTTFFVGGADDKVSVFFTLLIERERKIVKITKKERRLKIKPGYV